MNDQNDKACPLEADNDDNKAAFHKKNAIFSAMIRGLI